MLCCVEGPSLFWSDSVLCCVEGPSLFWRDSVLSGVEGPSLFWRDSVLSGMEGPSLFWRDSVLCGVEVLAYFGGILCYVGRSMLWGVEGPSFCKDSVHFIRSDDATCRCTSKYRLCLNYMVTVYIQ